MCDKNIKFKKRFKHNLTMFTPWQQHNTRQEQ